MSEQDLTLADAIQIALEAEQQAAALYTEAAQKTANTVMERLFSGLAGFEQHHYDKLTELVASLKKKGKYIAYEGQPSSIAAQSEIKLTDEAARVLAGQKVSLMDILTLAQNAERDASKRYTKLAGQTSDRDGKDMFKQLAKEEQNHLQLVTEVYWNLNDRGMIAWSKG